MLIRLFQHILHVQWYTCMQIGIDDYNYNVYTIIIIIRRLF